MQPYLSSSATVVYRDVIYAYGGLRFDFETETDELYSYTLNESTGEMVVSLVSVNEGPICSTCSVVLYSNTGEIWVFAEPIYSTKSKFYQDNVPQEALQIVVPHIYNIINKTWSILPVNTLNGNYSTYYGRAYQTTVMGNDGTVYVLGGTYRNGYFQSYETTDETDTSLSTRAPSIITDGWYYNKTENSYNVMSLPTQEQYIYSTGYIDLDGNIGFLLGSNATADNYYVKYYIGTTLNVYNTTAKTWSVKYLEAPPINGDLEGGLMTTQVDYKRKLLYTVGGSQDNGTISYAFQNLYILDLVNNVWLNGNEVPESEAPTYLYGASSALIKNNSYFVRLFGAKSDGRQVVALNTIDILQLSFETPFDKATLEDGNLPIKWISTTLPVPKDKGVSTVMIIVSIIFPIIIIAVIFVFLYLYGRTVIPLIWNDFKYNTLWSQRKGEPIWIETSRLLLRTISFFIIVAFLVYNINNVLTSPVSEASFVEYIDSISIPDIRICFSGWNSSTLPTPSCNFDITSTYAPCELIQLSGYNYTPYYANELADPSLTTCYLYAPQIQDNVTEKNTTVTINTKGYTYKNDEVIFLQLYRPSEDINRVIYLNQALPGVDSVDIQEWSITDTKSELQQAIFPDSYTNIEYQEINYQKIQEDAKWNYFGIFPTYSESTNLTMRSTQSIIPNKFGSSDDEQPFFNAISISPQTFTKITITEKRDSTILDVIGAIGGVLGLIVGLQIYLFGNRPTKPWGVIQRRTGKYKKLSDELEKNFYLNEAQIPFVSPVHQRFVSISCDITNEKQKNNPDLLPQEVPFSITEPLENRIARLEARNQLLEMVLKSYYIDDEVFLALDFARRNSERDVEAVVMTPYTK